VPLLFELTSIETNKIISVRIPSRRMTDRKLPPIRRLITKAAATRLVKSGPSFGYFILCKIGILFTRLFTPLTDF